MVLGNVVTGTVEQVAGTSGVVQALPMPPDIATIQHDGSTARVIRQDLRGTYSSTIGVFQAGSIESAASSPDGRFVAVETDQGLYVANEHVPASWQHAPMFRLSAVSSGMAWLPDSSGFVFEAAPDGQPGLYLARLNLGTIKIVEDNEPVAQVPPRLSTPAPTPTPAGPPDGGPRSIRDINFRDYLIARNSLQEVCKDLGEPIKDLHVDYADLLQDGKEEALVAATTCAMGNGGADIVEVFKLDEQGKPVSLKIDDSSYAGTDLYQGQFRTPHLQALNGKLSRWFIRRMPGDHSLDVETKRVITYQWSGEKFVLQEVNDLPASPDPSPTPP